MRPSPVSSRAAPLREQSDSEVNRLSSSSIRLLEPTGVVDLGSPYPSWPLPTQSSSDEAAGVSGFTPTLPQSGANLPPPPPALWGSLPRSGAHGPPRSAYAPTAPAASRPSQRYHAGSAEAGVPAPLRTSAQRSKLQPSGARSSRNPPSQSPLAPPQLYGPPRSAFSSRPSTPKQRLRRPLPQLPSVQESPSPNAPRMERTGLRGSTGSGPRLSLTNAPPLFPSLSEGTPGQTWRSNRPGRLSTAADSAFRPAMPAPAHYSPQASYSAMAPPGAPGGLPLPQASRLSQWPRPVRVPSRPASTIRAVPHGWPLASTAGAEGALHQVPRPVAQGLSAQGERQYPTRRSSLPVDTARTMSTGDIPIVSRTLPAEGFTSAEPAGFGQDLAPPPLRPKNSRRWSQPGRTARAGLRSEVPGIVASPLSRTTTADDPLSLVRGPRSAPLALRAGREQHPQRPTNSGDVLTGRQPTLATSSTTQTTNTSFGSLHGQTELHRRPDPLPDPAGPASTIRAVTASSKSSGTNESDSTQGSSAQIPPVPPISGVATSKDEAQGSRMKRPATHRNSRLSSDANNNNNGHEQRKRRAGSSSTSHTSHTSLHSRKSISVVSLSSGEGVLVASVSFDGGPAAVLPKRKKRDSRPLSTIRVVGDQQEQQQQQQRLPEQGTGALPVAAHSRGGRRHIAAAPFFDGASDAPPESNGAGIRSSAFIDGASGVPRRPATADLRAPPSARSSIVFNAFPEWARIYYSRGAPDTFFDAAAAADTSQGLTGDWRHAAAAAAAAAGRGGGNRTRPADGGDWHGLAVPGRVSPIPGPGRRMYRSTLRRPAPDLWSPHLQPDRHAKRLSMWQVPHVEESLASGVLNRRRLQIALFCLGFIFPLAWIVAAFLPLPRNPRSTDAEEEAAKEASMTDFERNVQLIDVERHDSARWWRNLNRILSLVGIVVVGAIITLVAVATRQQSRS